MMTKFAGRLLLFTAIALAAQIVISLDYSLQPPPRGEGTMADWTRAVKVGVPPENHYRPDSALLYFQSLMKTHPSLGFVFKENLGEDEPLELGWADQESGPVTSDEFGFINSPYAIEARSNGEHPNIIGVGSSFMQGAAAKFHDFFWAKGTFYYSMATHRHTFPQFTTAMKEYAIPLRPDWILYDLNEASFELLRDYEEWSQSGLDWFAYHSGTWSGPPKPKPVPVLRNIPALERIYRGVRRRVAPEPPIPGLPDDQAVARAMEHILEAHGAAREQGIRFLVLAIPSRGAALYGKGGRLRAMESIIPMLEREGVPVLNLLPHFLAEEDPRALYYRIDAHWNDYGIYRAGMAVAARLDSMKAAVAPRH